jgi:hypothetical protein
MALLVEVETSPDSESIPDEQKQTKTTFFWENLKTEMVDSFKNQIPKNFKEVSTPAMTTNTLWRGLNLGGVAADGALVATSYQIGLSVFLTCFAVDAVRHIYENYSKIKKPQYPEDPALVGCELISAAIKKYIEEKTYIKSAELSWKFLFGVIGWTTGYDYLGEIFKNSGLAPLIAKALGAALGTGSSLFIACESVEAFEVYARKKKTDMDHSSSMGVAMRGAVEGAVWSIVGDKNIHEILAAKKVPSGLAKAIDSLGVGISSGLAYCLATPVSSFFNAMYGHGFFGKEKKESNLEKPLVTKSESEKITIIVETPGSSIQFDRNSS